MGNVGGRRPIAFSAGVSGILGNGGSSKKEKLSLQDIAELIRARACQRVVVMVGAGISTPSGIPDFRCPAVPTLPSLPSLDSSEGLRAFGFSLQVTRQRPLQQPPSVRRPLPRGHF